MSETYHDNLSGTDVGKLTLVTESSVGGVSGARIVRRVSAFTAACVLISNMIGTGIFGTTGFMARDIGDPALILLLWVLGGGFALLGAVSYSELGSAMPRAGGEYVYIREAYGPIWGFLSGWTSFTVGFSAASTLLFAIHLRELLPAIQLPDGALGSWHAYLFHPKMIGLAMVWALTFVHILGVGAGGFLQRVLTAIKVCAIVLLILGGVTVGAGEWSNLAREDPSVQFTFSTMLVSFLFVTFSYSGWNAASYIAGEITDPGRSIPRAMIWGTSCVSILYVALNIVYLYAMQAVELAGEPIEAVAQKTSVAMFGHAAAGWVTALLCISILGAASAMIWAGPRVYYAMAQDGVFPAMFAEISKSGGAPVKSIILQSVWVSILVLVGGFEELVVYASFVLIVFAGLAVGGVLLLRAKKPDLVRPYRVWPYPFVPFAYIAISLAIMWAALKIRPTESLLGVATVLAGIPCYAYWKWRALRAKARMPSL